MSDDKVKKLAIEGIKPPKKDDPGYDYVGVLLEAVQSDFKAFGEGLEFIKTELAAVKEKGEITFEELGKFKEETAANFIRVDEHLDHIDERLDCIEVEVKSIKNELQELKTVLAKKADVEKLQELEKRVIRIEETLKLKMSNS